MGQQLPKDRFITIQGIKTRYWDVGRGTKTLVLLHGYTGAILNFAGNIDGFAKEYRVVALDLPGHGETEKPDVSYTYDFFTAFIKDFFQALGIDKMILVGHSMGAIISLFYIIANPFEVEKMVLIGPPLGENYSLPMRLVTIPFVGEMMFQAPKTVDDVRGIVKTLTYNRVTFEEYQYESFFRYWNSPGYQRAMLRYLRHVLNLFGVKPSFMRKYREMTEQLRNIKIPVFQILGKQDQTALYDDVKSVLRDTIPGIQCWDVDHCGHCPHWEYPDELQKRVKTFLSR